MRYHAGNKQCEKYLLRSAFSKENFMGYNMQPLLPDCILWRTKEAFSDGVSKLNRSLYTIIQEGIPECRGCNFINNEKIIPDTNEKKYYRNIFEKLYPGLSNIVPYFWMPKYVDAVDASARTLAIYNKA